MTRPAQKDLRAVPGRDLARIDDAFEHMRGDPYGGDIQGLKGTAGVLRRRAGSWRIFEVDPKQRRIVILAVKRRTSTTS